MLKNVKKKLEQKRSKKNSVKFQVIKFLNKNVFRNDVVESFFLGQ